MDAGILAAIVAQMQISNKDEKETEMLNSDRMLQVGLQLLPCWCAGPEGGGAASSSTGAKSSELQTQDHAQHAAGGTAAQPMAGRLVRLCNGACMCL